jgi:hypothetical protein
MTTGPEPGEAIGEFAGEPLFHASLGPAEYRDSLAASGFEVVDHRPRDPECGELTVWLAHHIGLSEAKASNRRRRRGRGRGRSRR